MILTSISKIREEEVPPNSREPSINDGEFRPRNCESAINDRISGANDRRFEIFNRSTADSEQTAEYLCQQL